MFCPQCKAEYRRGFTRCHDCDIDLVYELPPSPSSDLQSDDSTGMRILDRYVHQNAVVADCYTLREQGIPYRVVEAPGGMRFDQRAGRRYVLFVSEQHYEQSKTAVGLLQDAPIEFSVEDWQQMEEPAEDGKPAQWMERESEPHPESDTDDDYPPTIFDDFLRDQEFRRQAYRESWSPEDATVSVWDQDDVDISDVIQMFLEENYIHCRVDSGHQPRKFYVHPEDARAARDFVNELASSAPPHATGPGFRFCPFCWLEFRPGFDRCNDCQVPLVATRSEALASASLLWRGDREETLDLILRVLDAAELPSYQRERGSLGPAFRAFGFSMGRQVQIKYEIRVFRSDLQRARAAIAGNPELKP